MLFTKINKFSVRFCAISNSTDLQLIMPFNFGSYLLSLWHLTSQRFNFRILLCDKISGLLVIFVKVCCFYVVYPLPINSPNNAMYIR